MKTAVISGGTKGLGRALGMALARRGFSIVALYRSDHAAAVGFASEAIASTLAARAIAVDVARDDLDALAEVPEIAAAEQLVLVNNACAPFTPRPMHLIPIAELDALLDSTVRGSFRLTQALLRPLLRTRGTVVNVLSAAIANAVPPGFSAYAVAKSGLLGLTRALAGEYGRRGLRVLSVSPGFMDTELTAHWPSELRERAAADAHDPDVVASFTARLIEDSSVAGAGEDHSPSREVR